MGLQIKEARERLGITQKALALRVGVKPSTFNGYETGAHDPKSEILQRIASTLDTTTDYLLGLTNDPSPAIEKSPAANSEAYELALQIMKMSPDDRAKVLDYARLLENQRKP